MSDKYHYRESGLDNIWLASGFQLGKDEFGEWVHIEDPEGLHEEIGNTLLMKQARLSGAEVKFLRHEMDLTQERLGNYFSLSSQTVANWEKNKNGGIDEAHDVLLRHIYKQSTGQSSIYIEELKKMQELDQLEYKGFVFQDKDAGWSGVALSA